MKINKLFKNRLFLFLSAYVLLRFFLLNINYTEWGDTFRMIRGAEYLTHFDWPWDEKRWPFYSLLLIPGIWLQAPVIWGRILSVFISATTLYYVYKFYEKYFSKNKTYSMLAVILTGTSTVFAYWSFRVKADPVFSLLVLVYSFYFIGLYQNSSKSRSYKSKFMLSAILLMLTMTRLEGLFMLTGTGLFFLLKSLRKTMKDIFIFFVPQILIYFPWTLYAKILYKGPVSNDYLQEVQTFVFDLNRFGYFFTYTLFILVLPIFTYFAIYGAKKLIKTLQSQGVKAYLPFIPIGAFIVQEFIIGFIWTPSLPRIYTPVIPFLIMFVAFGIEKWKIDRVKFIVGVAGLTVFFAIFQYKYQMYFLGASKVLFGLIVFSSIVSIAIVVLNWRVKKLLIILAILMNITISYVIINNQRLIYKSVVQGIDYVLEETSGVVAYSDETGNTEWYLRDRGYYLPRDIQPEKASEQYKTFQENNVDYMLWTDEFNRGSRFIEPKVDSRYRLKAVYSQAIRDPFDILLDKVGLIEDSDYTIFITKIYEIR